MPPEGPGPTTRAGPGFGRSPFPRGSRATAPLQRSSGPGPGTRGATQTVPSPGGQATRPHITM
eukprot:15454228-Alexandrium_andersonii.AAC.1